MQTQKITKPLHTCLISSEQICNSYYLLLHYYIVWLAMQLTTILYIPTTVRHLQLPGKCRSRNYLQQTIFPFWCLLLFSCSYFSLIYLWHIIYPFIDYTGCLKTGDIFWILSDKKDILNGYMKNKYKIKQINQCNFHYKQLNGLFF